MQINIPSIVEKEMIEKVKSKGNYNILPRRRKTGG